MHVSLKPVPSGFAQKLPPRLGPPMMFVPGVLVVFQSLSPLEIVVSHPKLKLLVLLKRLL